MNDVDSTLVAHCGARKVTRDELKAIPVPEGTRTHQPLAHHKVVEILEEALSFRSLKVRRDEYAVSPNGMKMFGVMDLSFGFEEASFSIGLRNSNDKSMRLALTSGYRVFVCDNMAFSGDFTPLFHKHTRNFELVDSISVAVDRICRKFATIEKQVAEMRQFGLTDNAAKLLIYRVFMERAVRGVPRSLMPVVHECYFRPELESFQARNIWSLSNAFTSAFKKLAPITQFEATARLGSFMNCVREERMSLAHHFDWASEEPIEMDAIDQDTGMQCDSDSVIGIDQVKIEEEEMSIPELTPAPDSLTEEYETKVAAA